MSYNRRAQGRSYRGSPNLIRNDMFTNKQKKFIEDTITQRLVEQEVELSEYFSNLQLEMMRQFMIQKDEIKHFS